MPRRNPFVVPGAANSAPQFRFWGNVKPPTDRAPVRAQVSSSGDGAGKASIRLYAPIDSWGGVWGVSAVEFADALDALDNSVNTIELHINSPGGEVYEGIAILNLLRQHDATVNSIVDGLAASAASFLGVGSDSLVMSENSQLMIHDAWGIAIGPAADMHQMGDLLDKISGNIASIYQAKAGGEMADWRGAMLAETWYDAQEAVDAGLADAVEGAAAADPENAFDLSVFKHKGRAQAPNPPLPAENSTEDRPGALTALQERRHRMNARRHALPL